jgi:hypothetical protein
MPLCPPDESLDGISSRTGHLHIDFVGVVGDELKTGSFRIEHLAAAGDEARPIRFGRNDDPQSAAAELATRLTVVCTACL